MELRPVNLEGPQPLVLLLWKVPTFLLALCAGLRSVDVEPFSPQAQQRVQIRAQYWVLVEVLLAWLAEDGAARGICSLWWSRSWKAALYLKASVLRHCCLPQTRPTHKVLAWNGDICPVCTVLLCVKWYNAVQAGRHMGGLCILVWEQVRSLPCSSLSPLHEKGLAWQPARGHRRRLSLLQGTAKCPDGLSHENTPPPSYEHPHCLARQHPSGSALCSVYCLLAEVKKVCSTARPLW